MTYNKGMSEQATVDLDAIMEEAGAALAEMDYLTCESLCLQALAHARDQKNWAAYGRILMPLQETRRQRRMIAAEGMIRLGTATLQGEPADWLHHCHAGALVVTHPHDRDAAAQLATLARQRRQCVEVLFADNPVDVEKWTLRSFDGPATDCSVSAPPRSWVDTWLSEREASTPNEPDAVTGGITPGSWLIHAMEKLGDAALMALADHSPDENLIESLEACLRVVPDHELILQRLSGVVKTIRVHHR